MHIVIPPFAKFARENVLNLYRLKIMTLLVGWVGIDNRKVDSFYIASDSRLTWGSRQKYDCGKKILALKNSPDLIAYCGDVLFPIITLHKIADKDRNRLLFKGDETNEEKSKIILSEIQNSFKNYPIEQINGTIDFVHISRTNRYDFLASNFHWNRKQGWTSTLYNLPNKSDKVFILGSGSDSYIKIYEEYIRRSSSIKTSRLIFQSFCHWLSCCKPNIITCGGAPQLIGLFNNENGKDFGVIFEKSRFFSGQELLYKTGIDLNFIPWFNENFEICDGFSMKRKAQAQVQPNDMKK